MHKIYIDASYGCGPIMSGFARYTHGLIKELIRQPQSSAFECCFLTDISPDVKHNSQWIVTSKNNWVKFLTSTENIAYHDLSSAKDIGPGNDDLLPPISCDLFVTLHDMIALTHYLIHRDPEEAEIYRTKMTHLLRRSEAVVTVSQASKDAICEQLPSISPEKIQVIYPGVSACFRPVDRERSRHWCSRFGVDPERPIILNSGAYHPHKNLRSLLYAFALVKEHWPDVQLVLTGAMRPGHAAFWYHILLKLKIENDVIVTGRVTDVDLSYFYSAADVFVYPSLVEGFGLPPVEAEYCGAPVIASDIPIFREVLSDTAVLIPPLDYKVLSEAILQSLTQPIDAIGKSHPQRQYSWDEAARQYYNLYETYSIPGSER